MNKKRPKGIHFLLVSCLLTLGMGCNKKQEADKGPGFNTVYADLTAKPLLDSEQMAFEGLAEENKLKTKALSEKDLFQAFTHDSTHLILAARGLNDEETKSFAAQQLVVQQAKIATDGIALIVNKELSIKNLSWQQLLDIVNGKITDWSELEPGSKLGKLQVVFDDPNSAIIRQLEDSLRKEGERPATFFALHSPDEVVSHIEKNKNGIGLIGVSWISEHNDTTAGSFVGRINVLALENKDDHEFYLPLAAYLATKQYPLIRYLYLISKGNTARFPFANFATAEKGQRVVLTMGLVPATVPVRLVNIKSEF